MTRGQRDFSCNQVASLLTWSHRINIAKSMEQRISIEYYCSTLMLMAVINGLPLEIRVFQPAPEVVISKDNILRLSSTWNSGLEPDVIIHFYELKDDIDLPRIDLSNYGNTTVAYISTEMCWVTLPEIFHQISEPIVEINKDPLCESAVLPDNILNYPTVLPFETIFAWIMAENSWESAQVFYDGNYGYYLTRVLQYFDDRMIPFTLFRVDSGSDILYIKQLLSKSQHSNISDTNNIILCHATETLTILKQADELDDWQTRLEGDIVHKTRWLALCLESQCLPQLLSATLSMEYLAVLNIDYNINYPIDQRLKDVINAVVQAGRISTTSNQYSERDSLAPNDTSFSKVTMVDAIRHKLEEGRYSRTCIPYKLATMTSVANRISLVPNRLCAHDGRTLQEVPLYPMEVYGFSGRHFRIYTIVSRPFVMRRQINDGYKFYGMCIDMLRELASMLNFTYTLKPVPDGQYGGKTASGNWTGLVGLIQRGEADLVVASLTASSSRKEVMDFVYYYYEYGGVLLKTPDENEDKWQVILKPFRMAVWLCLLASVPIAGAVAATLSKAFYRAVPGKKDKFVQPSYSIWYTFGALITQGGSYLPKSSSSRYFICSWWAFSIVVVATYGGSLIAYLTITKSDTPFNTLEELVSQNRYTWGTKMGSVYFSEFQTAKTGIKARLYKGIQKAAEVDPAVQDTRTRVHLEKVMQGNYAFITDRTPLTVEAISDKACSLVLMKEIFMPMPFGIGIPEGSPLRRKLEFAVKKLRQAGLIQYWEQKWWPKTECSGIPIAEAQAITLMDTQSAFYLLLLGIFSASVTLTIEHCKEAATRKRKCIKRTETNCTTITTLDSFSEEGAIESMYEYHISSPGIQDTVC